MKTIPVSVRLSIDQIAKARDGLIIRGIDSDALVTRSQILRLSIFLAITETANPEESASDESLLIAGR